MEPILASFGTVLAGVIFVVICLLLMGIILIQKGRGGGLGGAFGGAGGHSAFGAKTGDVFTWITVVLASLFIIVAALLNFVFTPITLESETPTMVAPTTAVQPQATTPAQPEATPVGAAPAATDVTVQPEAAVQPETALPAGEQTPADQ